MMTLDEYYYSNGLSVSDYQIRMKLDGHDDGRPRSFLRYHRRRTWTHEYDGDRKLTRVALVAAQDALHDFSVVEGIKTSSSFLSFTRWLTGARCPSTRFGAGVVAATSAKDR
jgi:hypothetical protein